jgi:hypothetical protein
MRAFGIPEITIMAIQHYSLIGFAYVEVNGKKGLLITVKTGGPHLKYSLSTRNRTT